MLRFCLAAFLTFTSSFVVAANGRGDFDIDDDGLIEINDWVDLDEIRNNLDGTTLYGVSTGCPAEGCIGFELTADLDFDTNGDGAITSDDAYWNSGYGWLPIGGRYAPFTGVFEGNGRTIRNLVINHPLSSYVGVFSYTSGAEIRGLGLTGSLMLITGQNSVGSIAGGSHATDIASSYSTGSVMGGWSVGGLVGVATESSFTACFTTGSVIGSMSVGGITGIGSVTSIGSSFSTASVKGEEYVGGLSGLQVDITGSFATGHIDSGGLSGPLTGYTGQVTESYWATDIYRLVDEYTKGTGASLREMQCPTAPDNSSCSTSVLYAGWAESITGTGGAEWDFGDGTQLPGLRLYGTTYRDSDGDGVLDGDDTFPNVYAASSDSDGDGAIDTWSLGCDADCQAGSGLVLDQFPYNTAAILDLDLDGLPEEWHSNCDSACQDASGLSLDHYLGDADNDGIPDAVDDDDNGDGLTDADLNSDGLLEIDSLEKLDAMRHDRKGTALQLVRDAPINSSGCPVRVVNGLLQRACHGYELVSDLDFDTNLNGTIDETDSFWNDGAGWQPIGTEGRGRFSATFEGNGHVIRNLMINRPDSSFQGLFGAIDSADIRNLGLEQPSVAGGALAGALVGVSYRSRITSTYSTGDVSTTGGVSSFTGGLIGRAYHTHIRGSFTTGSVSGVNYYVGGIVGAVSESELHAVFSTANVNGLGEIGGLIGSGGSVFQSFAAGSLADTSSTSGLGRFLTAFASYWATDASGVLWSSSGNGLLLNELQCPTSSDDTSCTVGETLYAGWSSAQTDDGLPYWDFGSRYQLPALVLNGIAYRDSDADGILDNLDDDLDGDSAPNADDDFPSNYAVAADGDADGIPGAWVDSCGEPCQRLSGVRLDAFPTNPAVSLDSDADGVPDAWNDACDSACQKSSGLRLDDLPHSIAASVDIDSDGAPDMWNDGCDATCQTSSGLILDAFPDQIAVSLDDDGDGVPDFWNDGCDSECRVDSGLVLDAFPQERAVSSDLDGDGVPDSWNQGCDQACRTSSGLTLDAFPTNAAVSIDADGDGFADSWNINCDADCQAESSLVLDDLPNTISAYADTDGDGAPDFWNENCDAACQAGSELVIDVFPDSPAVSVDRDQDGVPDAWNPECDDSCQDSAGVVLDAFPDRNEISVDSDSDGFADSWNDGCDQTCQESSGLVLDDLPNAGAAYADADGDGSPDFWNDTCDEACRTQSGLALDAFPMNMAASNDADGDGLPDSWSDSCNLTCREHSGLFLDPLQNDVDNDGVPDDYDVDQTADNGRPEIFSVPENMVVAATGTTTAVTLQLNDVVAYDAVDASVAVEVFLNGEALHMDELNQVILPSGALTLEWMAVDRSGNYSEPVMQQVDIYPLVHFTASELLTGEASNALITVSLSGPSPRYPVVVAIDWLKDDSTASLEDIGSTATTGVDLANLVLWHTDGSPPTEDAVNIQLVDDAVLEGDEVMVFRINSAVAGVTDPVDMPLDAESQQLVLTITDTNLAPEIRVDMMQSGLATTSIDPGAGDVTVTAIVTDPNGNDTHSYAWNAESLPVAPYDQRSFVFDPFAMEPGAYSLTVTATDDGDPALTSEEAVLPFKIQEPSSPDVSNSGPDSGGGGSVNLGFLLLCLLSCLAFRRETYGS
jgi:hypothetical protein